MKTSLCIPLTSKHFKWLPNLFKSIEEYTEMPDEIVISASSVPDQQQAFENIVNVAKQYKITTQLSLFITNEKFLVGKNRNICIENASGDLLIFHDADDIAHPQRINILRTLFETNNNIALVLQHYNLTHMKNGMFEVPFGKDTKNQK